MKSKQQKGTVAVDIKYKEITIKDIDAFHVGIDTNRGYQNNLGNILMHYEKTKRRKK